MSEELILAYMETTLMKAGYTRYHLKHRDFTIVAGEILRINSSNSLFIIVGDPCEVIVESDYGIYDTTGEYLRENSHEHKGEITVENPGDEDVRIKFMQAIIIS